MLRILLVCVALRNMQCVAEDAKDKATRSDKQIDYQQANQRKLKAHDELTARPIGDDANITRLLDSLVKNYDKRIRPNYGGAPVEVLVTAHITTISAVSEVSMDYTLDLYLRQFWRDPRLSFGNSNEESLTIGIEMVQSIWTPDTFFPNEKASFFHEATSHNSFLRIDSNGNVLRSVRLTVTANCPMNLQTFPLDQQTCALEIESYGYGTKDIQYHWRFDKDKSVSIDENVHLANFKIGPHRHIERVITLSTGNYSRLTAFFTFKRNIGFYLIQIYLPASLIVVISWVSFWLNREATQARVAIGVTTVLTMTTLMTSTNSSMPKVSYVKSIDVFLGVCFFIVFASLLEYATVGYLLKWAKARPEDAQPSNKKSSVGITMHPFYGTTYDRRLQSVGGQPADGECECLIVQSPKPTGKQKQKASLVQCAIDEQCKRRSILQTGIERTDEAGFVTRPTTRAITIQEEHNQANELMINRQLCGAVEFVQQPPVSTVVHQMEFADRPRRVCCSSMSVRPSSIDKWSRFLFPLIFFIFQVIYWVWFANKGGEAGQEWPL